MSDQKNNRGRLVDINVVEEDGELGLSLYYSRIIVDGDDKQYDLYIPFLKLGFGRDTIPNIEEQIDSLAVGGIGAKYVAVNFDEQKYYLKPSNVNVLSKNHRTRDVRDVFYAVVDRTEEGPPKYTIDEIFKTLNAQDDSCVKFDEGFIRKVKGLMAKTFTSHTCENCKHRYDVYAGGTYFKKCAKCGKEKKNWERRY